MEFEELNSQDKLSEKLFQDPQLSANTDLLFILFLYKQWTNKHEEIKTRTITQ